MIVIEGKYGIKATVLADSINAASDRMLGYEIEYPRIILAELNTHRANPKNSHSSRAIPFAKMKTQLTGRPVRFGQANPGMQDKGEDYDNPIMFDPELGITMPPEEVWDEARQAAIDFAEMIFEAGYHKQVYNRLTEPFQMMRTVISGTEWGNFFWLRHDGAADPTLAELARVMLEARKASKPVRLEPGEWHLPYVETCVEQGTGTVGYYIEEQYHDETIRRQLPLEQAVKVSAARSAAVSFRNEDYGLEKCLEVFDRLVGDQRKHASAFEHQCTPMEEAYEYYARGGCNMYIEDSVNVPWIPETWQEGITHMDRSMKLWSGPLKGFIQYRKLIPGECYTGTAFD